MKKKMIDVYNLPDDLEKILTKSEIKAIKSTAERYADEMVDMFFDRCDYITPIEKRLPDEFFDDDFSEQIYERVHGFLIDKYSEHMAEHILGGIEGMLKHIVNKSHKKYDVVFVGEKIIIVNNEDKLKEFTNELNKEGR